MREAVFIEKVLALALVAEFKKSRSRKAVTTGRLGGQTRARNLSPERRREIARHANEVRWTRRKEGK